MSIEIIIAGILSVVVLTVIIFNTYFGLLLFTILILLRPGDSFPVLIPFHLTRLVGAFTFFVFFVQQKNKKMPILKKYPHIKQLNLLLVIMFLSILTSIWKSNSLNQFFEFLKIYMVFILIINLINSKKRLMVIVWTMLLCGLFIASTSILQYFQNSKLVDNYRMRAGGAGMFTDPNDLALCFVMLIPFGYYFLIQKKHLMKKIFLGLCLVVFSVGVILTYSRSGALGLVGVLFLIFLRSRSKIKALFGLTLIILLFFNLASTKYIERIKTIPESYKEDAAAISRLDAWKAGISMMGHRLFGVGIGNFVEGFVIYRPENAVDFSGLRRAPHNTFLQIGGETGVVGLTVFMALVITSLISLIKTKKDFAKSKMKKSVYIMHFSDATLVSLLGFLISGSFLSHAYNWFLYYLFGFSIVLKELSKNYEQAD